MSASMSASSMQSVPSMVDLETRIDALGYRHQASVAGYGRMMLTIVDGLQIVAKKLVNLFDLRRLINVGIVVAGICLVAYLLAMEVGMRQARSESRCYKNKQLYSRNNQTTAIMSKNGTNLMAISYDSYAKLSRTACMCPGGNVLNAFSFKRFDFKTRLISNDATNCMCDSDYLVTPGSMVINGDKRLVQFMSTGDRDDAKAVFGVVAGSSLAATA